jgi:ATP-dependent DNA ligase
VKTPLGGRRKLLEAFARKHLRGQKILRLSPATTKIAVARKWLKQGGANLDGIIAKRRDVPYESGNRHGMQKIKNYRSADCVVGGFRYNEGKRTVGSLLLGLYDEQGLLNHVGFTSSLKSGEKKALTAKLEKLVAPPQLHRRQTRRSEPLVDETLGGVEAAPAEAGGRDLLRPFQRWAFPSRDKADALAARQGTPAMHDGSSASEKSGFDEVAEVTRDSRDFTAATSHSRATLRRRDRANR